MNDLEISLQVEIKRTAQRFRSDLEVLRFPRSIRTAIPENTPKGNSEQNSWCQHVPERLFYRHDRCCTTTTVAVTSTCRVRSMPELPRHDS
jgi:hypothetical protein